MLTDERHDVIRALLLSDGRVVANELAARFGVSEDTVRRDLRELAKAGYCRRVHGGALAPAPVAMPISARVEKDAGTKTRLAAEAVKLLHPRHTVFIDSGSTIPVVSTIEATNIFEHVGSEWHLVQHHASMAIRERDDSDWDPSQN